MPDLIQRGDIRWYRPARPDKRRPVAMPTHDSIHTSYIAANWIRFITRSKTHSLPITSLCALSMPITPVLIE